MTVHTFNAFVLEVDPLDESEPFELFGRREVEFSGNGSAFQNLLGHSRWTRERQEKTSTPVAGVNVHLPGSSAYLRARFAGSI